MKRNFLTLCLSALLALSALFVVACGGGDTGNIKATVEKPDEDTVIVTVTETDENAKLYDVLVVLQEEGKLTFTMNGTYVAGLEGREGGQTDAGWEYWAFYVTDEAYGDGEFVYGETTYYYASLGAKDLPVKAGEKYLFLYSVY